MDATEYELRKMIIELQNRIANLEEQAVMKDDLHEEVRTMAVRWGVIEGAAEDE